MRKRQEFGGDSAPRKRKNLVASDTSSRIRGRSLSLRIFCVGVGLWLFSCAMLFIVALTPPSLKQNPILVAIRNTLYCGTYNGTFIEERPQITLEDGKTTNFYNLSFG